MSLKGPVVPGERSSRRGGIRGELLLALLPTATVLLVLAFVEALAQQRLLFASLASSAFLIYLDPEHEMNCVRTLVLSQIGAAGIGWLCHAALEPGYLAAGLSMLAVIGAMVALDLMYPPAVSTALNFGLQAAGEHSLVLFIITVAITAVLVACSRWCCAWYGACAATLPPTFVPADCACSMRVQAAGRPDLAAGAPVGPSGTVAVGSSASTCAPLRAVPSTSKPMSCRYACSSQAAMASSLTMRIRADAQSLTGRVTKEAWIQGLRAGGSVDAAQHTLPALDQPGPSACRSTA